MTKKSDNFGWGVACGLAVGIGIGALSTDEAPPEIQKARMEHRIAVAKAERKLPSLIRYFSTKAAERACAEYPDFNHKEGAEESIETLLEHLTTLETVQLLEFLQKNNVLLRKMSAPMSAPVVVYFNNASTNERVLAIKNGYTNAGNSRNTDVIKDLSYSLQHLEDLSTNFSFTISDGSGFFATTELTKIDGALPIKVDRWSSIHPCPQPK